MPMYELFYSTGGHVGPYHTYEQAEEAADRLLKGSRQEAWIDIQRYVPRCQEAPSGFLQVQRKRKEGVPWYGQP